MNENILDNASNEPSFFKSIWHWLLLGIACFLALFTFIPLWALLINLLIKLAWGVFVVVEFQKNEKPNEAEDNSYPSNGLLKLGAIAGGTIVLWFCTFVTNDHFTHVQTFPTPTADVYIYSRNENFIIGIDPPTYILRRQLYPYPFMETIETGLNGFIDGDVPVIDSIIILNNVPIYDLRTHQVL